MENKEIIEYVEDNFPDELKLIERSLINFYTIKNKKEKTDEDEDLSKIIYSGVISLLRAIAHHLSEVHGISHVTLFKQIKKIYIKT